MAFKSNLCQKTTSKINNNEEVGKAEMGQKYIITFIILQRKIMYPFWWNGCKMKWPGGKVNVTMVELKIGHTTKKSQKEVKEVYIALREKDWRNLRPGGKEQENK